MEVTMHLMDVFPDNKKAGYFLEYTFNLERSVIIPWEERIPPEEIYKLEQEINKKIDETIEAYASKYRK